MTMLLSIVIERYQIVRDEVRVRAPLQWIEVEKLCRNVPKVIDLAAVWQHGRDKPCWSNIKEEIGRRLASNLRLSPDFESHKIIANEDWDIGMRDGGRKWKSNSNFVVRGKSAKEFVAHLPRRGISSYLWRLYAIREFARSLCREDGALAMVNELGAASYRLSASEVYPWSKQFAKVAGRGWGPTTVNHMLTDLGLSIKPDIHVSRSAVRMGLLGPDIPSRLPDQEIKKLDSVLGPRIVLALLTLAEHIEPTAWPTAHSALREIDKVLMEWSKQELLRPLGP